MAMSSVSVVSQLTPAAPLLAGPLDLSLVTRAGRPRRPGSSSGERRDPGPEPPGTQQEGLHGVGAGEVRPRGRGHERAIRCAWPTIETAFRERTSSWLISTSDASGCSRCLPVHEQLASNPGPESRKALAFIQVRRERRRLGRQSSICRRGSSASRSRNSAMNGNVKKSRSGLLSG